MCSQLLPTARNRSQLLPTAPNYSQLLFAHYPKVNICGGPASAKAAMVAAGIPAEALPAWVGGSYGESGAAYDLIERMVGEHLDGRCEGVRAEAKAR